MRKNGPIQSRLRGNRLQQLMSVRGQRGVGFTSYIVAHATGNDIIVVPTISVECEIKRKWVTEHHNNKSSVYVFPTFLTLASYNSHKLCGVRKSTVWVDNSVNSQDWTYRILHQDISRLVRFGGVEQFISFAY